MAKFRFHKIAAVVVLVATAAWIATGEFSSVGSARQEAEPAAVETETTPAALKSVQVAVPPRVEHARTIHISGQTQADKHAILAARTAGIVEELLVTEGTLVEAGDLILRLESEGKEAAVTSARQTLAQREAEAKAAERLASSGNIASLRLDEARAALASARSALELAEADLNRTRVEAPFPGVINTVEVEEGGALLQGAEVATLLKLDPIVAVGEISEHDLGAIHTGDEADVQLVSGETLTGKIRHISRAASPQTRTYRIEVSAPNPDLRFPAGMTAEISVLARQVEAVALPRSVVTLNSEGDLGVRVVDSSGVVRFHPVEIIDDSAEALYLAGVPAGARVIVAGQGFVIEGEKVIAEAVASGRIGDLAGTGVPGTR